jgi:DNA-binding NarL/FixJ family response regulator
MLAISNLTVLSESRFYEEATAEALRSNLTGWEPEQAITVIVDDPWGFALKTLEVTKGSTANSLTVVITSNTCPEYLEDLWELNLMALVTSDLGTESVVQAIKLASQERRTRMTPTVGTPLTFKERRVLRHCAEGMSDSEISSKLYMEPHTASNHLYKIYEKLEIKGRQKLMLYYWGMKTLAKADNTGEIT